MTKYKMKKQDLEDVADPEEMDRLVYGEDSDKENLRNKPRSVPRK